MSKQYCLKCEKEGKKIELTLKHGLGVTQYDEYGDEMPKHETDFYKCPECGEEYRIGSDGKPKPFPK